VSDWARLRTALINNKIPLAKTDRTPTPVSGKPVARQKDHPNLLAGRNGPNPAEPRWKMWRTKQEFIGAILNRFGSEATFLDLVYAQLGDPANMRWLLEMMYGKPGSKLTLTVDEEHIFLALGKVCGEQLGTEQADALINALTEEIQNNHGLESDFQKRR
jgi:hypothetical protein